MELEELRDRLCQLEKLVSELVKWTKFNVNPATRNWCEEDESSVLGEFPVNQNEPQNDDDVTIDEIEVKVEQSSDYESSQRHLDNSLENVLDPEIDGDFNFNDRNEPFLRNNYETVDTEPTDPLALGEDPMPMSSSVPTSSSSRRLQYQVFDPFQSISTEPQRQNLFVVVNPTSLTTGPVNINRINNVTPNPGVSRPAPVLNCIQCGIKFEKLSNFNKHKKIHNMERQFRCKEKGCNMLFTFSYGLRKHIQKVHKSKPFACPLCSKKFPRNDLVDIHVEFSHSKIDTG